MTNEAQILAESQSAEAVNAAATHAEAVGKAMKSQLESALQHNEERLSSIVKSQMENVLAMGTEQEKTMILARVKYVCQDIKDMKQIQKEIMDALEEIREQADQRALNFALLQQQAALTNKIVFGFIALILVGFVGALSMLVFK